VVKARLSKDKLVPLFSFLLLFILLSVPIFTVSGLLPRFTGHIIGAKTPYINQSPRVTVFISFTDDNGNDISGLIGSITLDFFWSRDKTSWYSITMSAQGTDTYYADIPSQDGLDNWQFDEGAGPCYWYVRIENNKNEVDFYYSSENPNDEIYFYDIGQTTVVIEPEDNKTGAKVSPLAEIPLAVIQELFDPTGNIFVKITVIVIALIAVYIWATRGKGFKFIQGLFKRG
jgi:hypothetical protein